MKDFIKINENDNVIVALKELTAGETILAGTQEVTARETIPAGHKMAIRDIAAGAEVIKYGFRIGNAKENIAAGQWVHVHNLKTALGDLLEYTYEPVETNVKKTEDVKFMGFARANGKVGVRNEVWIIPTVGCVNNIAAAMAKAANARVKGSVEEVIAFPHPYGCSQMGDDQEHTRTILADLVNHPNAGGVLVLGLGCENSNIGELKKYIGDYDENRVKFLVCQECEDEMEEGAKLLNELIDYASMFEREPISASKLIVGMKCGGSDGFSGITANPLVGRFSDLLIGKGGTTILTEVPEMFGAETILMNRCSDEGLFEQTVHLINDFKEYFLSHGEPVGENPSPGNKAGGISTLEEKALGCTQKCGKSYVSGVMPYGERLQKKGLNLLSAPGNDLVAATTLAACGCHMVLFTTGRGTPFGTFVPTMKISTNSNLAKNKPGWIDFNAGVIVENEPMEKTCERFIDYVIKVASGEFVNNEKKGYREIAIFKTGVTL